MLGRKRALVTSTVFGGTQRHKVDFAYCLRRTRAHDGLMYARRYADECALH